LPPQRFHSNEKADFIVHAFVLNSKEVYPLYADANHTLPGMYQEYALS
jgi:hypothetical protein